MYNYVRKGTVGTGAQQASALDIYPFLWGDLKKYSYFQTLVQYEFIHDLFLKLSYQQNDLSQQNLSSNKKIFSFALNYSF